MARQKQPILIDSAKQQQPQSSIAKWQGHILQLLTSLQQNHCQLQQQLTVILANLKPDFNILGLKFSSNKYNIELTTGNCSSKYHANFRLALQDNIVGDLELFTPTTLQANTITDISHILNFCTYPIFNSLEHNLIQQLNNLDPLTQVGNKQAMWHDLAKEIDIASRHKSPLCVLVLDLDNFKGINDTWGHQVGDNVLLAISKTISYCLRKSDSLYRFGGDEFILLLRNTNIYGGYDLSQRILTAIPHIANSLHIAQKVETTISIGLATFLPTDNKDTLFARADAALYRAKKQKNSVSA